MFKPLLAIPFLALLLAAAPAYADEEEAAAKEETEEKAAPEEAVKAKAEAGEHHGEEEEWMEYRSFMTTFGGVTIARAEAGEGEHGSSGEAWEAAATWGFDYSFRVNAWLAVGAYFDFASGRVQELLVGPCVFIFPWEGLFIELSPSVERDQHGDLFFVARAALGYEWELTPQFLLGLYGAVDYVRGGVAFVPGVTMGFGF